MDDVHGNPPVVETLSMLDSEASSGSCQQDFVSDPVAATQGSVHESRIAKSAIGIEGLASDHGRGRWQHIAQTQRSCQEGFVSVSDHNTMSDNGVHVDSCNDSSLQCAPLETSLVSRLSSCVGFASSSEISSAIVAICTAVPHKTAGTISQKALANNARLMELRRERTSLDRGSAALRANRREANRLIRLRETTKFHADGGLRRRRYFESWRSLSFLSFVRNGEP